MLPGLVQHTLRGLLKSRAIPQQLIRCNTNFISGGLWEPPYLEEMKSKVPLYDTVNIQLKGYDFPILESYQRFVHKIATNLDIAVEEGWATPPQKLKVSTYKPQSAVLDHEYNLDLYERNVQITDVESTLLPVLMSAIVSSLPEGVTVNVHEHQPEHEKVRFIPDLELMELKDVLTGLGGPTSEKKKKR